MRITVTGTPTAVAGLTAGSTYALQNIGMLEIKLHPAPSAPGANDAGLLLSRLDRVRYQAASGEEIYVWAGSAGGDARGSHGSQGGTLYVGPAV